MSDLLLYLHILSASLALLAGATAVYLRKGSKPHKQAGKLFAYAMAAMAITALPLALAIGKFFDAMSSLLVCYLVFTSIRTFAPQRNSWDLGFTSLGIVTMMIYLWVEYQTAMTGVRATEAPIGAGYVFASILLGAATGDILFWRKGSFTRLHLLIRHLWRMCFAFFLATTSFFLARTHLFPEFFLESGLLYVLGLGPLVLLFYWTAHTLIIHWSRNRKLVIN